MAWLISGIQKKKNRKLTTIIHYDNKSKETKNTIMFTNALRKDQEYETTFERTWKSFSLNSPKYDFLICIIGIIVSELQSCGDSMGSDMGST